MANGSPEAAGSGVTTLRDYLLGKLKKFQISKDYQNILVSTTEDTLIAALKPIIEWTYRTGVLDRTALNMFTVLSLLNRYIYFQNSHYDIQSSSIPSGTRLQVFEQAFGAITGNTDAHKLSAYIQSSNQVDVTLSSTQYMDVEMRNSTSVISLSANSSAGIDAHNSVVAVNLSDSAVTEIRAMFGTVLTLSIINNGYAIVKAFQNSVVIIPTTVPNSSFDVRLSTGARIVRAVIVAPVHSEFSDEFSAEFD